MDHEKKGSINRDKQRLKVAKLHEKIENQRNDFLHKISNNYINNYDLIAIKDLQIQKMIKNNKLSGHINDASWNKFIQFLSYKAVTSGGVVIESDKTRGSSKRCSRCGNIQKIPLSKRIYKCNKCGLILHRDINSAISHLNDTLGQREIYKPDRDLAVKEIYEAGTKRDELLGEL